MTDEEIDRHLDNVLRASGSGLRHYSMASTLAAMRKAMRDALPDDAGSEWRQRAIDAEETLREVIEARMPGEARRVARLYFTSQSPSTRGEP